MGLRKPFGRPMAPPEFGSWAVRRFCEGYGCDTPVSLTAVDLRRADELGAHAAVLAAALDRVVGNPARRQSLAELFQRSQTDDGRPYVDVSDLCLTLVQRAMIRWSEKQREPSAISCSHLIRRPVEGAQRWRAAVRA